MSQAYKGRYLKFRLIFLYENGDIRDAAFALQIQSKDGGKMAARLRIESMHGMWNAKNVNRDIIHLEDYRIE